MSDPKPLLAFGVEKILGLSETPPEPAKKREVPEHLKMEIPAQFLMMAAGQVGPSGLGASSAQVKTQEGKSTKSRTTFCNRCRNHGRIIPYKGHKNVCPVWNCTCDQCILITARHKVNKQLAASVKNPSDP